MTRRLAALVVALALAPPALAQRGGDWVLGVAVGTGERAGLFVRAYPVADIGLEAHLLLVPLIDAGTVGVGGGVVVHPVADDRFTVGLTGHRLGSLYRGGGARRHGLTLDLGYEPRGRSAPLFVARAGVAVSRRQALGAEAERSGVPDGAWSAWRLRPAVHLGAARVVAGPDEAASPDG